MLCSKGRVGSSPTFGTTFRRENREHRALPVFVINDLSGTNSKVRAAEEPQKRPDATS